MTVETQWKPWQVRVECNKCHDIIWSKFAGEFVSCKCGAIAVDSTPYYSRYIGNREDFKFVDEVR